jgi:hypothetical protein
VPPLKDTIAVPRAELEHLRDELIELEKLLDEVIRRRFDVKLMRTRLDALLSQDPDKTPVRPPSGTFLAALEPPKGK